MVKLAKTRKDDDIVMYIIVRLDLNMSRGKIAAQVAHAAVGCYNKDAVKTLFRGKSHGGDWYSKNNQKKIILAVQTESELMAILGRAKEIEDLTTYIVFDSGATEIREGTPTALGIGPDWRQVAKIPVQHLPLLK